MKPLDKRLKFIEDAIQIERNEIRISQAVVRAISVIHQIVLDRMDKSAKESLPWSGEVGTGLLPLSPASQHKDFHICSTYSLQIRSTTSAGTSLIYNSVSASRRTMLRREVHRPSAKPAQN